MADFTAFLKEEHNVEINEAKKMLSTLLANTELNYVASDGILFVYDQLQKAEKALEKVYSSYDRQWRTSKRAKAQNMKLKRRLAKTGSDLKLEVIGKVGKKDVLGKKPTLHRIKRNHRLINLPREIPRERSEE